MGDLPENAKIPLDSETLDLIEAAIVNPGGEHSNLFGVLDVLSGTFVHDHATAGCKRINEEFWDCSATLTSIGPHDLILALIAELRRLRALIDDLRLRRGGSSMSPDFGWGERVEYRGPAIHLRGMKGTTAPPPDGFSPRWYALVLWDDGRVSTELQGHLTPPGKAS